MIISPTKLSIALTSLGFWLILSAIPSLAETFAPEVETLRQEISTLDRTRQSAIFENEQGQLTEQQQKATQQYISYLNSRITSLCAGLLSSTAGASSVAGLPCPPVDTLLPGYQAPASQTSTEQVDDLSRSLMESLGKFDEMLLDEQQKISSKRSTPSGNYGAEGGASGGNKQGDGASGPNGSSNSEEQGQSQERSTETEIRQQDQKTADSTQTGAGKGTGRSAKGSGAGAGKKPAATLPMTDDDDIVARQLREAAETETDPELKKKLWEEYRKYKGEVH